MNGGRNLDDKLIWDVFDKNKRCGFELFIDKYGDPLYRLCVSLYKNNIDSQDLFQDTWIKAFKYLSFFNRDKRFQAWLFTIAINLYKDNYRKVRRYFLKCIDSIDDDKKSFIMENIKTVNDIPEEEFDRHQCKQILKEGISALKDKYRIIIILFYYNDLKQKEISEILKIPEGTVKSRLNKAKKLLKEFMEEKGYEK